MNSLNEGIPDCPNCGGKGLCDEHKLEYLKWIYETAKDEYEAMLKECKAKLEMSIEQANKQEQKTERNQK